MLTVRHASADDVESLAEIWYQGWQDAHATILPAELARIRTRERFAKRLEQALHTVRVVSALNTMVGFCMTKDNELYQLYVSAGARGIGAAALLEADALAIIAGRGAGVAWLACAIGNDRAARFYEKSGWRRVGTETIQLEAEEGIFPLDVWRYEKVISEHRQEISRFPTALRILLAAELAAGNSIVEVGHSFPAPPAGAYIKLANAVSTRPRTSGDGINFYERNGSSYSGEFTDAKRFFFLLEPPLPPPPEPDMDAIRASYAPKPDSLTLLAQRAPGTAVDWVFGEAASIARPTEDARGESVRTSGSARRALTSTETATGATRLLHFRDRRPPHEVQFALERELMVLFAPVVGDSTLRLLAHGAVNGAPYTFELRFEAARALDNCYSLRVDVSWADSSATHHDYYRKTSDSWFSLWTRDLMMANPPDPDDGLPERYRQLVDVALQAESHLDSVEAIQRAIVAAMKQGGGYSTSHKEGGTSIFWRNGAFMRSDYGDDPDHIRYADEAEFLKKLWQFCHWEVTRHIGLESTAEFDTWKLILRRLTR